MALPHGAFSFDIVALIGTRYAMPSTLVCRRSMVTGEQRAPGGPVPTLRLTDGRPPGAVIDTSHEFCHVLPGRIVG